jgi:pimeloyl-ACP methyl ester carboxylesterase
VTKDDLATIAMPTLVVAGSRDQMAGDPQGLADLIPGARAVTLPGVDHFSAIPHALFKAAVFDFLDGYPDEQEGPPSW